MTILSCEEQIAAIEKSTTLSNDEKFQQKLILWDQFQRQLGELKKAEMDLRRDIFKITFPNPVEGSGNKFELAGGWIIQAKYPIDRKVDEALLQNMTSKFEKAKIPSDVIRWKAELSVTEYKKLTEAQQKVFDQVLIVKPGSPSLEIKLPKRV